MDVDPGQWTNKTLLRTVIFSLFLCLLMNHDLSLPSVRFWRNGGRRVRRLLSLKQDLSVIHASAHFGNKKTPKGLDTRRSLLPFPIFLHWNS